MTGVNDQISLSSARAELGKLINRKQTEIYQLQTRLDVANGELMALRNAEDAIANLVPKKPLTAVIK